MTSDDEKNTCSMFMDSVQRGTATINEDPLINLKNKVKMLLLCESSKKENKKLEKEKRRRIMMTPMSTDIRRGAG